MKKPNYQDLDPKVKQDIDNLQSDIDNINVTSDSIQTTDIGDYFSSTTVEGNLQEIGQVLNSTRGSLITSVNSLLNS